MNKKRKSVLCFLRKDNQILLALIEYPSGEKLWAGLGGYIEIDESEEDAVCREIDEETFIDLDKKNLVKKDEVEISPDLLLSVFLVDTWQGVIRAKESSIKDLKWFSVDELPYDEMHPETGGWLPKLLGV